MDERQVKETVEMRMEMRQEQERQDDGGLGVTEITWGEKLPIEQTEMNSRVENIVQKVMAEHPLKGIECDIRDKMQTMVLRAHQDGIWDNPVEFARFRMLVELIAMDMKEYEDKLIGLRGLAKGSDKAPLAS
ncbi:MAG: hypothetical protein AB1847_19735 [bacterium]